MIAINYENNPLVHTTVQDFILKIPVLDLKSGIVG